VNRVEAYLADLGGALRGGKTERFLTGIRDHLLEATAAGLELGLDQAAAETRAIELFGPPEVVARHYAAELAEAMWEKHMHTLRLVAIVFAVLTLYYARFFLAVRQEAATLVQIGVLLAAAAVLTLPVRSGPIGGAWFRGWRPVSTWGWASAIITLVLAVTVFEWADHNSHSASDTLNRAVPTLCLIVAIALRLAHQQDASRLTLRPD
jgi:hypothetical protein